jgi:hypothetical protein
LASATIPKVKAVSRPAIDYLGIGFVALGTAGLILGLSWGGTEYAWGSPIILGVFAISALALAIFVWVESRAVDPILPMRLFKRQVFSVCSILSFIVGFAMLGADVPADLSAVRQGVSVTGSGVQTLPLVIGLLGTSLASGIIVSRTGRYKVFPIAGSAISGPAYGCCRAWTPTELPHHGDRHDHLGRGIGPCMQVLTIIVQNTSDYRDPASRPPVSPFFRPWVVHSAPPSSARSIPTSSRTPCPALTKSPGVDPHDHHAQRLHAHPPAQIAPIIDAYSHALHVVFLAAVPVAAVAFVLALFLQEVPLRDTSRHGAADVGSGFGMPERAESLQLLQTAIARVFRTKGAAVRAQITGTAVLPAAAAPGTSAGVVHVRSQLNRDTASGHCSPSPPREVLQPVNKPVGRIPIGRHRPSPLNRAGPTRGRHLHRRDVGLARRRAATGRRRRRAAIRRPRRHRTNIIDEESELGPPPPSRSGWHRHPRRAELDAGAPRAPPTQPPSSRPPTRPVINARNSADPVTRSRRGSRSERLIWVPDGGQGGAHSDGYRAVRQNSTRVVGIVQPQSWDRSTATGYSSAAEAVLDEPADVTQASQGPPRADEVAVDVAALAGDDVAEMLRVAEGEGGEVE